MSDLAFEQRIGAERDQRRGVDGGSQIQSLNRGEEQRSRGREARSRGDEQREGGREQRRRAGRERQGRGGLTFGLAGADWPAAGGSGRREQTPAGRKAPSGEGSARRGGAAAAGEELRPATATARQGPGRRRGAATARSCDYESYPCVLLLPLPPIFPARGLLFPRPTPTARALPRERSQIAGAARFSAAYASWAPPKRRRGAACLRLGSRPA